MATDAWEVVRDRFVRLFGRDVEQTTVIETRLDKARAEIVAVDGPRRDEVVDAQQRVWEAELVSELVARPAVATPLGEWAAQVTAMLSARPDVTVHQHASATGNARQVVQGQGSQTISFGGPGDADSPR
ncbi:hypothetical protein [Actinokineospora sp. NBRC 105648]|uniref:hypothetical protein n=1 Tax=Actinokineospora sp. NBRC 105648 TaxID=3032206 RepID=UPI0024A26789|nr:hypothetical protein [Actinokineospora sp. NBRC 105648]GLZ43608.1 hypothetical protein Acsp05_72320 [Actinokineospora sp. NBRC 105648]